MTREEFETLRQGQRPPAPMVTAEVVAGPDRTLVYGYTLDRESFHVYLSGGEIHIHIWDASGSTIEHVADVELPATDLVPDKRAYPHATDVGFARLLNSLGVNIPFTTFRDDLAHWSGFYKPPFTAAEGVRA